MIQFVWERKEGRESLRRDTPLSLSLPPMRPGRRRAARLLLLLLLLLLAAQTCEPRARKARKARGSRRAGGAEQEQAAEPGDVYAARLVDAAFKAHQAGSFRDAVQQYRRAILALRSSSGGRPAETAHTLSLCAHNLAYLSAHELNDLGEARVYYAEATRVRPDYFEAYHNLGSALQDHGLFAEALGQFAAEQRLRPDLPAPYLASASCYHKLGDVESAAAQASRAAELDPSSTSAFNGAGWFLHLAGRSRMAEQILKRGIRLHPTNAAMHFHRGKVCLSARPTRAYACG